MQNNDEMVSFRLWLFSDMALLYDCASGYTCTETKMQHSKKNFWHWVDGEVWPVSFGSKASSDCTLHCNIGEVGRPGKNWNPFRFYCVATFS